MQRARLTTSKLNNRKTPYQLTGELKENQINTNITLAIVDNISGVVPMDVGEQGVIDTEPCLINELDNICKLINS